MIPEVLNVLVKIVVITSNSFVCCDGLRNRELGTYLLDQPKWQSDQLPG